MFQGVFHFSPVKISSLAFFLTLQKATAAADKLRNFMDGVANDDCKRATALLLGERNANFTRKKALQIFPANDTSPRVAVGEEKMFLSSP